MNSTYEVIEVCLLAGKIMLENGAETYRVEDTMARIASAYGIHHSHNYVTPTAIIFSIDGTEPAKLIRISQRSTDLHKVTIVNSISRKITSGEVTIKEAYKLLNEVNSTTPLYHLGWMIIAASISSGCFMIMFNGIWNDFIPSMIAGGLGFISVVYFHRIVQIKFFAEFMAAFIVGIVAVFFVEMGLGYQLDKIIIGSVMPLVPGLLITNAVRDLMAGHLVSGLSRGAEAFLTAFAIGTGIAAVLSIF